MLLALNGYCFVKAFDIRRVLPTVSICGDQVLVNVGGLVGIV